jgi:hypothetical protein
MLVESAKIKTKKVLTKSTREGSGTWDMGYTCPKVTVYADNDTKYSIQDVLIKPLQIVNPENELETTGIFLRFEKTNSIDSHFKNILIPHPSDKNTFILPYANIPDKFYLKRYGMFKILWFFGGRHTSIVGPVNDISKNGKKFRIKINLPYDGNDMLNVSQVQMDRLVYKITDSARNIPVTIRNIKLNIIQTAVRLEMDATILKDLKEFGEAHNKKLETTANKLGFLNKELYKPVIVKGMEGAKINNFNLQIRNLDSDISISNTKIIAYNEETDQILKILKKIEDDEKISKKDLVNFTDKLNSSKEILDSKIKNIINFQPRYKDHINQFYEEFYKNKNVNELNAKITEVIIATPLHK